MNLYQNKLNKMPHHVVMVSSNDFWVPILVPLCQTLIRLVNIISHGIEFNYLISQTINTVMSLCDIKYSIHVALYQTSINLKNIVSLHFQKAVFSCVIKNILCFHSFQILRFQKVLIKCQPPNATGDKIYIGSS